MALVVGREEDGTPIVFADATSGTLYRLDYRKGRDEAKTMPLEKLEVLLNELDQARLKRPLPIRAIVNTYNRIFPAPDELAYRDVLQQRKEQSSSQQ